MHTEKGEFLDKERKTKDLFLVSFAVNSHATYLLVLGVAPSCRGRMGMIITGALSDSHSFDLIFESNFYLADLFFCY